jgi:hypothetical protein
MLVRLHRRSALRDPDRVRCRFSFRTPVKLVLTFTFSVSSCYFDARKDDDDRPYSSSRLHAPCCCSYSPSGIRKYSFSPSFRLRTCILSFLPTRKSASPPSATLPFPPLPPVRIHSVTFQLIASIYPFTSNRSCYGHSFPRNARRTLLHWK